MSGHTPGPWAATRDTENSSKFFIKPSTFWQRGRTFGYKPLAVVDLDKRMAASSSAAANARLIAAAPDLLEALQGFIEGAEAIGWNTDKARAAIAKATGEAA